MVKYQTFAISQRRHGCCYGERSLPSWYNAPWHKGNDIKYLIESTGAKLLKLPPYSPDLNPIEHAWANLKQAIKLNKHKFENFETNLASQMQNMNHSNMA